MFYIQWIKLTHSVIHRYNGFLLKRGHKKIKMARMLQTDIDLGLAVNLIELHSGAMDTRSSGF
jgi:hypothetical protein